MSHDIVPNPLPNYGELLFEIKQRIQTAQYNALKVVNKELLNLYWDLGKTIAERQENETWGSAVVEQLSRDLVAEFGEKSGFSVRNLLYMWNSSAVVKQARLAVKDHYTFEFLGLAEQHAERELEQALLANVKHFLAEMGANFTFISNQYRLTVGGNDYFIDLLLYHRQLKSLIAIELKIGEFQPEHKGKMEFYLTALNEQVKLPDENEAIGIIICKSKNKTVVEYALKTAMLPIGIATYSLTPHLPENYRNLLPSEDEIASRLAGWDAE